MQRNGSIDREFNEFIQVVEALHKDISSNDYPRLLQYLTAHRSCIRTRAQLAKITGFIPYAYKFDFVESQEKIFAEQPKIAIEDDSAETCEQSHDSRFFATPTTYYSNGLNAKEQKVFRDEDVMLNLITEKSGLIDENSTIRTLTNTKYGTIEFQIFYEYDHSEEKFSHALIWFLNKAAGKNLNLEFAYKEVVECMSDYPTLTMQYSDLNRLIAGLRTIQAFPQNEMFLQGKMRTRLEAN